MTLSVMRKIIFGAIATVFVASSAFGQNFLDMDIETAKAVPTSCSASQMTVLYNSCLVHCAEQIPAFITCNDVNSRFMLVNCAAEADQCGSEATTANVVRQAQIKRIADVCNEATEFQLDEVKLMFAAAADVAAAMEAEELSTAQAQQRLESTRTSPKSGMYPSPAQANSQQTDSMYPAQQISASRATREMYGGKQETVPQQSQQQYGTPEQGNENILYQQTPVWEQAEGNENPVWDNGVTEEQGMYESSVSENSQVYENNVEEQQPTDTGSDQKQNVPGSPKPSIFNTYNGVGSQKPSVSRAYTGAGSLKPSFPNTYSDADSSQPSISKKYDGTGSSKPSISQSYNEVGSSKPTAKSSTGSGESKVNIGGDEGWWAPASNDEEETYAWNGPSGSTKPSKDLESSYGKSEGSSSDKQTAGGVSKTPAFNATKSKIMQYKSGNSTVFKSNKTGSGSGVSQMMPAAASILAVVFSTVLLAM